MEETHLKAQESEKKTPLLPSCWEEGELMKLEGKYVFDEAFSVQSQRKMKVPVCIFYALAGYLTTGWIWKIFAWIENLYIILQV